jgi:hypothetical protein
MNPEAESNNEESNAIKQAETAIKKTMNPEAESANNEEGSNAIKQAETAIKTNNEPRGRIRQRREQCYIKQAETAINN